MSAALTVAAGEHAIVRLFHVDLPKARIVALADPDPGSDHADDRLSLQSAAGRLLGVEGIDSSRIELFAVADISAVGLIAYLVEGVGLTEAQLAPDRTRLDAIEGFILVVPASAFGGKPAELRPVSGVTPVGTYEVPGMDMSFAPLHSEGARGITSPVSRATTDRRMNGMVAGLALLAMLLFVALMVWIA